MFEPLLIQEYCQVHSVHKLTFHIPIWNDEAILVVNTAGYFCNLVPGLEPATLQPVTNQQTTTVFFTVKIIKLLLK